MLPSVVFQDEVLIAIFNQMIADFDRHAGEGVHVISDGLLLADKFFKNIFPAAHQDAHFRENTVRHRFDEGRIHKVL